MPAQLKKYQGGGEIVEIALVLPLLFFLIFGIINGGLAIFDYNTLAAATREGARCGSVLGNKSETPIDQARADIIACVKKYAVGLSLTSDPEVVYDPDNNPGSKVIVTTRFTFTPIAPFFGLSIPMASKASMIIFY